MYITRNDFIKIFLYTTLFFVLLFGYNRVSGPYFETTYDSASINNQEVTPSEIIPLMTQDTQITTHHIARKNIQKTRLKQDPLMVSFNPENISIDQGVLDRLKEVVYSSYFESRVTPLQVVLDATRDEPRGQVV